MASCQKEEIGGTATQSLAGEWICTVYYDTSADADPVKWEEFSGPCAVFTYNTSANVPYEMWLEDPEFWDSKCKIQCNTGNLTFGAKDSVYIDVKSGDITKIWDGKITPDAAVAPGSGSKVDRIEYFVSFDYQGWQEYTFYVVGYRRTGFVSDEGNYIKDWDNMPKQY